MTPVQHRNILTRVQVRESRGLSIDVAAALVDGVPVVELTPSARDSDLSPADARALASAICAAAEEAEREARRATKRGGAA